MENFKRLYIFTGKGGVGKTTCAFSFALYLKSKNKKVRYLYFKNSSITDQTNELEQGQSLADKLNIDSVGLELKSCAQGYVSKKMKSETIGKLVVKTPFFKALVNMIPGFNYLIYLGFVLEFLHDDPDLIIILDSPSSGHALTMLEATHNFREIFSSGVVFDDTQKMIKLMFSPNFMQVNIMTIPTVMAVNEAHELHSKLQAIESMKTNIACNNCFSAIEGLEEEELPTFLINKIESEKEALSLLDNSNEKKIPHSPSIEQIDITKDLVNHMDSLV